MSVAGVTRRDRALVLVAMIALVALAWAHTIYLGFSSPTTSLSSSMAMPKMMAWSAADFVFMFVM